MNSKGVVKFDLLDVEKYFSAATDHLTRAYGAKTRLAEAIGLGQGAKSTITRIVSGGRDANDLKPQIAKALGMSVEAMVLLGYAIQAGFSEIDAKGWRLSPVNVRGVSIYSTDSAPKEFSHRDAEVMQAAIQLVESSPTSIAINPSAKATAILDVFSELRAKYAQNNAKKDVSISDVKKADMAMS